MKGTAVLHDWFGGVRVALDAGPDSRGQDAARYARRMFEFRRTVLTQVSSTRALRRRLRSSVQRRILQRDRRI